MNFSYSDSKTAQAIILCESEGKLRFKHLKFYLTEGIIPPESMIVISLTIQSMNKNHYSDQLVAGTIDF